MIIVEGAPKTGKTTLAHKLASLLDYIPISPPDCMEFDDYCSIPHSRLVCDTYHWTRVVTKRTSLSRESFGLVDGYLKWVPTFIVLLICKEDVVKSSGMSKEELRYSDAFNIIKRFRHWGAFDFQFHYAYREWESAPYIPDSEVYNIVSKYIEFREKCYKFLGGIGNGFNRGYSQV